jgi:hypothetical protein
MKGKRMKKQLFALFSLILFTNGIYAMEPLIIEKLPAPQKAIIIEERNILSPQDKIAELKARYKDFSADKKLEMVLWQLAFNPSQESLQAIDWLLAHEQVSPDILGDTLETALRRNFYDAFKLLLEHSADITDAVKISAQVNARLNNDDRYLKLLEKEEKMREEIR